MKKLLSILGAMALIGTTSTSVVACGGENPTPPTPDRKTGLSTIITKTSLDKIEMVGTVPTKEELLKGIKSKNVSANTLSENDFDFEGSPTATTATIEGKTNYKGKVTLTYEKDTTTNLSTIITKTSLDKIEMVGTVPTKEELLKGIKSKNVSANTLSENDFDFEGSPTATTATIEGKTNYKGKVTLTYEKDTTTNLSTIITKTSLDKIEMVGTVPTKEELLKGIKSKNVSANTLSENDFDFEGSPTATTATIEGKTNYKGKVTLTYEKDTTTNLSTIITKTSLDKIEMVGTVPTKEELLKGIKSKNVSANTLSENDFDFEGSPTATTATIEGKTNYKGKVTLTYEKDTRTDLSTITQLTGLSITADNTKTNNDLWTQIFTATEFKDLRYNSYETFMYKTNDIKDTTDIKQLNQEKGDIYIILQVNKSKGINCFGDTPRLKVTLK